ARGSVSAAHLARRDPEPRQRAPWRDVPDRTPPDTPGAGRAVHASPARAARDQAGDHRLGAGQRPRLASLGRADRARPLLHRTSLAGARRADPRAYAGHGPRRRRALQGRARRLGGRAVSADSTEAAGTAGQGRGAVLLTGVGKRYDIVSCFAALTRTIAADP